MIKLPIVGSIYKLANLGGESSHHFLSAGEAGGEGGEGGMVFYFSHSRAGALGMLSPSSSDLLVRDRDIRTLE